MTSPAEPASTDAAQARQQTKPLRELGALALLGANAVFLFVGLIRLFTPNEFVDITDRAGGAFFTFIGVEAVVLPLLAVLLATHISPIVPKAKLITQVALVEYALSVLFGTLTLLIWTVGRLAETEILDALLGVLSRFAWLVIFGVAAWVVFTVWRKLFYVPKPKSQPGVYGQPQPGWPQQQGGWPAQGQQAGQPQGGWPAPGQPGGQQQDGWPAQGQQQGGQQQGGWPGQPGGQPQDGWPQGGQPGQQGGQPQAQFPGQYGQPAPSFQSAPQSAPPFPQSGPPFPTAPQSAPPVNAAPQSAPPAPQSAPPAPQSAPPAPQSAPPAPPFGQPPSADPTQAIPRQSADPTQAISRQSADETEPISHQSADPTQAISRPADGDTDRTQYLNPGDHPTQPR
ncbi:hypothetical protein [Micromonospora profundi]|uniref:hypothetical protein n=1 Tax=Micromonospora profundi TaxID=1420889 RepID=UPI00365380E7